MATRIVNSASSKRILLLSSSLPSHGSLKKLHQRGLITITRTNPTLTLFGSSFLGKRSSYFLNNHHYDQVITTLIRRGFSSKQSLQTVHQDEEEKIVTTTKKSTAVLDQWLPDHIKARYHVLELGGEIYDAALNQTNVGDNNNKFYVIQVLESVDGGKFLVYNRWGRVGKKGQDKLQDHSSRESAIKEFEQKFLAKTKNAWSDRNNFVFHPKSYAWLEMDYSGKEKESKDTESPGQAVGKQPLESKLEPRIAKFISLVCNLNMMNQQMMEIGYNANKLPLGKLSKSTILKVALGEMAELLYSKYDADRLPEGKLSTKGVGATGPDFSKAQELEDGLIVPLAKPKKNSNIKGALLYNEYIVYNVEQIKMRYVINVKFNFRSRS